MKTWQRLKQNPALWRQYFVREQVLRSIREFFYERNFHEVEAPILAPSLPQESYVDVFETTLRSRNGKRTRAFLPTSPEPFLKKLIAAGIGDCFSLTKSFRNSEGLSTVHNPEFTILEYYQIGGDYMSVMGIAEALVEHIYHTLFPDRKDRFVHTYQGKEYNLSTPWQYVRMVDAFASHTGLSASDILDPQALKAYIRKQQYPYVDNYTWEQMFHYIYLNNVEQHLGEHALTVIYDYPIQLAALARKKPSDPRFAERAEVYLAGLELADAYSELTDADEQARRFEHQKNEKVKKQLHEHPTDEDFITALASGMPECGGIAIGIDRLIMFFADIADIADVLFFPAREEFGEEF